MNRRDDVSVIAGAPFPIRPAELSVDFVSKALGLRVDSFVTAPIGAERGMLGDLVLLTPDYVDEPGPESVVVKFAADREGSLGSALRSGSHARELRFYHELAPTTPVRVPGVYASWYDPETARFLIIQEAIDADTTVDQVIGITCREAELVLSEVARLHARWWRSPDLEHMDWLPRLDSQARRTNLGYLASNGLGPLQDLVGDGVDESLWSAVENLPRRVDEALCVLAQLPSTLLHSDLRADNLLFSPRRDAVVLVDWQGAGIGPPSWDLAYFLTQSLTVEMRRENEEQLLDTYCEYLRAAGVDACRDDVLAGYGLAMVFGLAVACSLPLVADPKEPRVRDLATAMASRALAGLADHATAS